ncbi:TMF family protein [Salinivibrio sp. KP-1]|uniref:rolling circle replication-associated protein n=1 Tax=Salinivibrio sp. KP-1 TaxID=1406902 RepID=UPI0006975AFE|nr:TMF family protein [Salinivibrio sp. KP-1]
MLDQNAILFATAGVVKSDPAKMRNNIINPQLAEGATPAAFFVSKNHELQRHQYYHSQNFALSDNERETARAAAARSAGDARLVKGCESPTGQSKKKKAILHKSRVLKKSIDRESGKNLVETVHAEAWSDGSASAPEKNRRFVVSHQEWSGKWRAGIHVQPRPTDAPDAQTGARFTENLTANAVRKIFEAAAYVATCHGGFTTFLTLTFDEQTRQRLFCADDAEPETTIGREVSRFLDGAKKMYQRGWTSTYQTERDSESKRLFCPIDSQPTKIDGAGRDSDFHYMWVAECPANENGEPNPHVHLLMRWNVEKPFFDNWAKRLEGIWGHGFAKLEHIQRPMAAGTYIIKAVGYAAKGKNAEQGLIRGNRYNIARASRAPAFEVVASFEAERMGAIIAGLREQLEAWKAPRLKARAKLKKQVAASARAYSIVKKSKKLTQAQIEKRLEKLKARLKQADSQIDAINAEIKARGVTVSRDHPLVHFDGADAEINLNSFLVYAAGAKGWSMAETRLDTDSGAHYCALDWQPIRQKAAKELGSKDAARRFAESVEKLKNDKRE